MEFVFPSLYYNPDKLYVFINGKIQPMLKHLFIFSVKNLFSLLGECCSLTSLISSREREREREKISKFREYKFSISIHGRYTT